MDTEKKQLTEERLQYLDNKIKKMTDLVFAELEDSGQEWFPITVYTTLNVLTMATEMAKRNGSSPNANLKDLTMAFCEELKKQANNGGLITFLDKN